MFPCEEIKHLCSQCGKEFSQKGYVVKHKREVHEGIKFPCRQCGKQFSSKENITKQAELGVPHSEIQVELE